jgi:hypothetical protein
MLNNTLSIDEEDYATFKKTTEEERENAFLGKSYVIPCRSYSLNSIFGYQAFIVSRQYKREVDIKDTKSQTISHR